MNDRVGAGHDARAIIGMNVPMPPLDIRADLVGHIAEQRLHPLVPPERVRGEIPAPNRIVGGARSDLESLLAFAQRHFRLFTFSDVDRHAEMPHGFTGGVVFRSSPVGDPSHRPIRPNNTEFVHEFLPLSNRRFEMSPHARSVVGVDQRGEGVTCRRKPASIDAEYSKDLLRPPELILRQVEIVDAHLTGLQRERQPFTFKAKRRLSPAPLRNVGPGRGEEQDPPSLVLDRNNDHIGDPLGPVGQKVWVFLPKEPAFGRLSNPLLDHIHHAQRPIPPATIPKFLTDDFLSAKPAAFQ